MFNTTTIRPLGKEELSMVSGGYDEIFVFAFPDNFLVEQFQLFRLGHPSVFGPNPDGQMTDPPQPMP